MTQRVRRSPPTFQADCADLLAGWLAALTNADRADRTRQRYLSALRHFIAFVERETHQPFDPLRLTPIDLMAYRKQLQDLQASVSAINVAIAALRSFCAWLVDTGQRADNPASRLKAVKRQQRMLPKALESTEINALLRLAQRSRHPQRDYALMQMLLQTGMRVGECAALRIGDLSFSERTGRVRIRAGKGNKERWVPLNRSVRQALADYLAPHWNSEPTTKAVGARLSAVDPHAPLWRSQKGGALGARAVIGVVEKLVADGVHARLVPSGTTAHALRHTFATHYLKDHPGDLVGLGMLLGHDSLETTRVYVQLTAAELGQRVEDTRLNAY